jgi:threonylcarbamoyladenosine tRNA methylthiotransferase MtaB
VAISTDVIVGFPSESEEEFAESHDFCRRMHFARIHVFPYSPRSGTEAAHMPRPVSAATRRQRTERMLALAAESAEAFRRRFSGRILPVLWERRTADGRWTGLTGNYIRLFTQSDEDLGNRVTMVKVG